MLFSSYCLTLPFSATTTGWLTTCMVAVVVEATLQQPVLLLVTGVLGDFVEESASFLLDIMDVF